MATYDVVVRAEERIVVVAFSEKDARSFVQDSIEQDVLGLVPEVVSVVEREGPR